LRLRADEIGTFKNMNEGIILRLIQINDKNFETYSQPALSQVVLDRKYFKNRVNELFGFTGEQLKEYYIYLNKTTMGNWAIRLNKD